MGFKTDSSFDHVCILNDSFRGRLLPFGQWVFDKSRGQLNIYANVFFEHESNESNESCKCAALAISKIRYWMVSFSAAASGNACKSVWNPYINQKTKVKKDPWSKTPCASDKSVSAFLTFVLWP